VYPSEGTLVADHPYVVLRAPWVDEAKRRAAALFLTYLEDPQRQERFRAEGFRDHEGRGGPDLVQRWGVLPAGPGTVLPAPSADTLAAVEGSWKEVRKRARVLMVLDVSGSMAGQKLDLMKRGAAASLDLFLDDDELAVWAFATTRFDIAPMGPVGPPVPSWSGASPDSSRRAERACTTRRSKRCSLSPLCRTRRISAVVVLTDGVNTKWADRSRDHPARASRGHRGDARPDLHDRVRHRGRSIDPAAHRRGDARCVVRRIESRVDRDRVPGGRRELLMRTSRRLDRADSHSPSRSPLPTCSSARSGRSPSAPACSSTC